MKDRKSTHGRGTALAESPEFRGSPDQGPLVAGAARGDFFELGRVVLLERIRETGSIAAAARYLDMAYSHAWKLVADMNRLGGQDLVGRSFGGQDGGPAWLTPAGEEAVAGFWQLVGEFRD